MMNLPQVHQFCSKARRQHSLISTTERTRMSPHPTRLPVVRVPEQESVRATSIGLSVFRRLHRVGAAHFFELTDELGDRLVDIGREFGTVRAAPSSRLA